MLNSSFAFGPVRAAESRSFTEVNDLGPGLEAHSFLMCEASDAGDLTTLIAIRFRGVLILLKRGRMT